MILTRTEYDQYLRVHLGLLYFVGLRQQVIPAESTFEDFLSYEFIEKFHCREALYQNLKLVEDYIRENKGTLSEADVQILGNFHKSIRGEFVILKCLSSHAIFISAKGNTIYAVKALADPFQSLIDAFPALCKTTLVPYGNKIIYDGFIEMHNIILGPGLKRSLTEEYRKAKANKTIITKIV